MGREAGSVNEPGRPWDCGRTGSGELSAPRGSDVALKGSLGSSGAHRSLWVLSSVGWGWSSPAPPTVESSLEGPLRGLKPPVTQLGGSPCHPVTLRTQLQSKQPFQACLQLLSLLVWAQQGARRSLLLPPPTHSRLRWKASQGSGSLLSWEWLT